MHLKCTANAGHTPSNARLAIMVAVLGIGYFFSYFHRMSLAVISSDIIRDCSLDAVSLGILGSAYYYTYAIIQIPCGFIVDRIGPRVTISCCLLITSLGSFWFGFTDIFNELVISRAIIGFGVGCIYVPALRAIREWGKAEQCGFFTGVIFSMGTLGALCASAPLTFMVKFQGWRWIFYEIGILTLALAVIAWFAILGRREKSAQSEAEASVRTLPQHGQSGTIRHFWNLELTALAIWFFCFFGTKLSFQGLWAAPYLSSVFGFTNEHIGFALMSFGVGNVCAGPIVGFLADHWGNRQLLLATNVVVALLWLTMANWTGGMSLSFALFFYFLMGFFGGGALTSGFTAIGLYAKKEYSGSILGIINATAMVGTAIFTQSTGKLVTFFAPYGIVKSYQILYGIFFVLLSMCTMLVYFTQKREA